MSLLQNVLWSFSRKFYPTVPDFAQAVADYQVRIHGSSENWHPDEVVLVSPRVQVQYEAWVVATDLLANDRLVTAGTFDGAPKEGKYYNADIVCDLESDKPEVGFGAAELLMKTHNQMSNKELGDHVFFEGFTLIEDGEVPVYAILCGS